MSSVDGNYRGFVWNRHEGEHVRTPRSPSEPSLSLGSDATLRSFLATLCMINALFSRVLTRPLCPCSSDLWAICVSRAICVVVQSKWRPFPLYGRAVPGGVSLDDIAGLLNTVAGFSRNCHCKGMVLRLWIDRLRCYWFSIIYSQRI